MNKGSVALFRTSFIKVLRSTALPRFANPEKTGGINMRNMSEQEEKILKNIFARIRKICVDDADDPMVKATIQTLHDTKVVVNEEE